MDKEFSALRLEQKEIDNCKKEIEELKKRNEELTIENQLIRIGNIEDFELQLWQSKTNFARQHRNAS